MRLIAYSPAPMSYTRDGHVSVSRDGNADFDPDSRLTATTAESYSSSHEHPLVSKPADISDTSNPIHSHTPTHVFPTFAEYYRAQSWSASSLPPGPASPQSSTTLVPPPSPAYFRTHEPSRLATSTLPQEQHAARGPAESATSENGVKLPVVAGSDHTHTPPAAISISTGSQGADRTPTYRARRPFPDLQTLPPSTTPHISGPSPHADVFRRIGDVPASPSAAPTPTPRGMRSRSSSTTTTTAHRTPEPREDVRRGTSRSASSRPSTAEDVSKGSAEVHRERGRAPRLLRRVSTAAIGEDGGGAKDRVVYPDDGDAFQPSSYFED